MLKNKTIIKSGAVSIFMVVFTTMLISVLAFGFVRLMMRDQRQSTQADLSQSAYDSALAGVEDAKRAIVSYSLGCNYGTSNTIECLELRNNYFNGSSCDVVSRVLDGVAGGEERLIQTSTSSNDEYLNQAYTCVRINYDTSDYLGKLNADNQGITIPLRSQSGAVAKVVISWYTQENLPDSAVSKNVKLASSFVGTLVKDQQWATNTPPVLVAQYFRLAKLSDYDIDGAAFKTAFLYPVASGLNTFQFSSVDVRGKLTQLPPIKGVECSPTLDSKVYACSATLDLPVVVPANSNTHFLRLTKRYNTEADFQVKLLDASGNLLNFSGVQPSVDSNGRANDQFRRVESRVEPIGFNSVPLPSAAIEISKGDFCKNMQVDVDVSPKTVFNCD